MANGFALVEFDENVRRIGEETKFQAKIDGVTNWLRNPTVEGWPQGVTVGAIRGITRIYGGRHTPKFNLFVELKAGSDPDAPPTPPELEDLKRACRLLEAHCHVEGFV